MPAPACTPDGESDILLLWESWGGPHQCCDKRGAGFPLHQCWSSCCRSPGPPRQVGGQGYHPSRVLPVLLGTQTWLAVFLCFSLVLRAGPCLSSVRDLQLANSPRCASVSPGLGVAAVSCPPSLKADAVCVCSPCLCLP